LAIHREYVQDTERDTASESEPGNGTDDQSPATGTADVDVDPEDEDLLEKERNASNGEKFERLWNGNTVGYDSQSEADMAPGCLLAFWTGGDRTQMKQPVPAVGFFGRSGTRSTTLTGRRNGEKTIERGLHHVGVLRPDAGDDTADDTPGGSSPDVGAADSERSRAYLAEKNRLLSERVDELEATLTGENRAHRLSKREIERLH